MIICVTGEFREAEIAIAHHGLVGRAGRYGSPEWFASGDRINAALDALIVAGRARNADLARWADDGGAEP